MYYDFTFLCYLRFFSGLTALVIAVLLIKRIKSPGAPYLLLFLVSAAIWSAGDGFEAAAKSIALKVNWSSISYIGVTTSPVFFLLFTLQYSNPARIIRKGLIILLFLIPVTTIIIAFTNQSHLLLWKKVVLTADTNLGVYYYGPYFLIHVTYEYAILTIGLIILLAGAFKVFSIYRPQLWILIIGTLLPFISSILYVLKLLPVKGIDPTPISFILTGIVILISLYKYRFFNIMPFARKQAIDNLSDGIFIVDVNNCIVDYNPALCKIAELENADLCDHQAGTILEKLGININDFTRENNYSVEGRKGNVGNEIYYEVKCHPIYDRFKKEIGKLFLVSDITARKMIFKEISDSNLRIKAEILEKEKLIMDLDAYARSVAHDLKNPAGAIVGFSELIGINLAQNEQQKALQMLDHVKELSQKMIGIIDGLLMLSKLRKEEIELVPVDMESIVDSAIFRLKSEIDSSHAVINKPSGWPQVKGNSFWIEEVWFNLISNALKYGGKPPIIKIQYSAVPQDQYKFMISDNGNGLPAESLAIVFRDFERLGVKDIQGYGLGLPIVKRIIDKLGGEVTVESTNKKGEGCTFSFTMKSCT